MKYQIREWYLAESICHLVREESSDYDVHVDVLSCEIWSEFRKATSTKDSLMVYCSSDWDPESGCGEYNASYRAIILIEKSFHTDAP